MAKFIAIKKHGEGPHMESVKQERKNLMACGS